MIKQFQTRLQPITMILILIALVIVIATKVKAGTNYACPDGITQTCDTEVSSGFKELTSELTDFSWSPILSFFSLK